MKSMYDLDIVDGVLCIEDVGPHDRYATVTNNTEQMMAEIKASLSGTLPEIVIYRDSEGQWDGITLQADGDVSFYMLGTTNRTKAIGYAKNKHI